MPRMQNVEAPFFSDQPSKTRFARALAIFVFFALCGSLVAQDEKGEALLQDEALTSNLLSAPGPTFQIPARLVSKTWSLIAYGDMRFTNPANNEVANPKVRRWIVEQVAREHPDAILLSGDVPYRGSDKNDYDVYRTETSIWRDQNLRVFPALGNHELQAAEIRQPSNWWAAFPELKNRRWYSVEFDNAYIIALDSNLSLNQGSKQRQWLDDQLAHLPISTKFVFVSLHHPPVADGLKDDSSHDVRPNERQLAELLERYTAKPSVKFIVIAGHIHNYERFLQKDVIYIVSGGGGAKPYEVTRTPADLYQEHSYPNFHYIKFQCVGDSLTATMHRLRDPASNSPAWDVKDSFFVAAPPSQVNSHKIAKQE